MRKSGGLTKKKLTVHLGEVLRAARTRLDWTQADVAERVGVATEVYGRMERGNLTPSVPNLRALCLVLRIEADAALGLASIGAAEWLKEPAAVEEETPRMRRLLRALRRLDDKQLAVMSMVVRTLAPATGEPSSPEEASALDEPLLDELREFEESEPLDDPMPFADKSPAKD